MRKRREPNGPPNPVVDERPEGWLWQLGKLSKMPEAEMDEWSSEGQTHALCVMKLIELLCLQVTAFNGSVLKPKCNAGRSKKSRNSQSC